MYDSLVIGRTTDRVIDYCSFLFLIFFFPSADVFVVVSAALNLFCSTDGSICLQLLVGNNKLDEDIGKTVRLVRHVNRRKEIAKQCSVHWFVIVCSQFAILYMRERGRI
jgi:hypothetical protein